MERYREDGVQSKAKTVIIRSLLEPDKNMASEIGRVLAIWQQSNNKT
jgi:hypothetical protein